MKSDLTWKQAKEQGLVVPEPVPSKDYEFIEFRTVITGGEKIQIMLVPQRAWQHLGQQLLV